MNIPYVMRKCTKCGGWKVANNINFCKSKTGKWGLQSNCKECRKKYYKDNKEHINNKNKEYYKNNKDDVTRYKKEYYKNNKNDILNKNKIYREEHKEQIKITKKEERIKNKDRYKEYHKNYYENNKGKYFNYSNKRRSKLELQGEITNEQWFEMMEFFNWTCAYSGEYLGGDNKDRKRTIDHIVPLDKNGENKPWNCVPMLRSYNSNKRTNNMLEWYLKQPFFSIERLTKIYEWRIYAYEKWGK